MEETLPKTTNSQVLPVPEKEIDFFVERFAQILLMQIEHENEHEQKPRRIHTAV